MISLISFIIAYKNLLEVREEVTKDFFNMMNEHIRLNRSVECIICDYGSTDGIEEFLKDTQIRYVYVEPNPNEYLNLSKCLNAGIVNSRNPIIAPTSTDIRFDQELIDGVLQLFQILGEIILRIRCFKLNKDGKLHTMTYSPYFLYKPNIILSGGYDERMHGWGKEDDDILERIYKYQKIMELRVRNLYYTHLWHDDSFRLETDVPDLKKNTNLTYMVENIQNNGKNLINSYWNIEHE